MLPYARRGASSAALVALAGLTRVLAAQDGPPQDIPVQLPPRWFAGDTHVHTQPCGPGPTIDVATIIADQLATGVQIACGAYWNPQKTQAGQDFYFNVLEPTIDGSLDPASQAQALLRFGVEVSGFNSSQFGHVCGIGITDGAFPNLEYPGPDLEYFLAQPGAIAGYSHVRWPLHYNALSDEQLAHLVPSMLPIDAVLGAATFVEAFNIDPFDTLDWRGIYYKLLNAGVRVALTGGTDNLCIYPAIGPIRTCVGTTALVPDFDLWLEGVRLGRSAISCDPEVFLDITAGMASLGDWLYLEPGKPLRPRIKVYATPGEAKSGPLELVFNGAVVAATTVDLPAGGVQVWEPMYLPSESGWFAARFAHVAHTAAIYLSVGKQPIASTTDAVYLREHCQRLVVPPPQFEVTVSAAAIATRCNAAIAMYDALARIETQQVGLLRYGESVSGCDGPLVVGASGTPVGGTTIDVTCLHAPAQAFGVIVIGQDADMASTPVHGVPFYVDLTAPYVVDPVSSNGGGFAARSYTLDPGMVGQALHLQFAWVGAGACDLVPEIVTSDALRVLVQ